MVRLFRETEKELCRLLHGLGRAPCDINLQAITSMQRKTKKPMTYKKGMLLIKRDCVSWIKGRRTVSYLMLPWYFLP